MGKVLVVEEWKGGSRRWYVADTHTWTNWRACADIFDVDTIEDYIDILENKYHAVIHKILKDADEEPLNVIFSWPQDNYRDAHQFKLDVNRIARKKSYLV